MMHVNALDRRHQLEQRLQHPPRRVADGVGEKQEEEAEDAHGVRLEHCVARALRRLGGGGEKGAEGVADQRGHRGTRLHHRARDRKWRGTGDGGDLDRLVGGDGEDAQGGVEHGGGASPDTEREPPLRQRGAVSLG